MEESQERREDTRDRFFLEWITSGEKEKGESDHDAARLGKGKKGGEKPPASQAIEGRSQKKKNNEGGHFYSFLSLSA